MDTTNHAREAPSSQDLSDTNSLAGPQITNGVTSTGLPGFNATSSQLRSCCASVSRDTIDSNLAETVTGQDRLDSRRSKCGDTVCAEDTPRMPEDAGSSLPCQSDDQIPSESRYVEASTSTSSLESGAMPSRLLAERCMVLLYLCEPSIEKLQSVLSGLDRSNATHDPGLHTAAGMRAHPTSSVSSPSNGGNAIAELVAMLRAVQQSSLVTDEVSFLKRQLPSLQVLGHGADNWSEDYYECRMCSSGTN